MAKKSGSKSSRSERRAGRKRAERAVEHGLPTRKLPPPRARAATPEPGSWSEGADRSSDAPAPVAKPAGIPTIVKVLGGALVILVGVYLLSRQREDALTETKPSAEPAAAAASVAPVPEPAAEASAPAPVVAAPEVAAPEVAAPEVTPAPEPPAAIVPVTPPTKPVVVAPAAAVVPVPSKPKVEKAVVAAPAAVTPAAAVPVPVAPAPVAAPVPPKPAAPLAPKATPPVDNPY